MAFRKPGNLQCLYLHHEATLDDITDQVIGYSRVDMEIFYIDVRVRDADGTFSATTVTLEYEDIGGGTDTAIDAISVAANTEWTRVDADDLTEGTVPADKQFILTINDVATGADQGIDLYIWYLNEDAQSV